MSECACLAIQQVVQDFSIFILPNRDTLFIFELYIYDSKTGAPLLYYGSSKCTVRKGATGTTCTIFKYDEQTFAARVQAEETVTISNFKLTLPKLKKRALGKLGAAAQAASATASVGTGASAVAVR